MDQSKCEERSKERREDVCALRGLTPRSSPEEATLPKEGRRDCQEGSQQRWSTLSVVRITLTKSPCAFPPPPHHPGSW